MSASQINTKFQSFDDTSHAEGPARLLALRQLMKAKNLDVWLVPHTDEYQNEYPAPYARRISWLSGFTGSAGWIVVTADEAVVFVDGRYTLQAENQIDGKHFTIGDLVNKPPHKWLGEWLNKNVAVKKFRIGYDAQVTTLTAIKHFEKFASPADYKLIAHENLIDEIWQDQPPHPLEPVDIHPDEFTGKLARQKIKELQDKLNEEKADFCLITDPASIAWLFNIRGSDLPHTPLALGTCLLPADGFAHLFMDKRKMSREVEAYLTQLSHLHPPSQIEQELAGITKNAVIMADPAKTSSAFGEIILTAGGRLVEKPDPVIALRATKNEAEILGSQAAHLRDGVAVTKFLFWLDSQKPGTVTEISAAEKLEHLRATTAKKFQSKLMDISFDTISGAGKNGAIIHYRVTRSSNATLEDNSLYLVDSGGQYRDGTTDITRTIAIGTPPEGAVEDFTLVLKGHIAIALARFPKGTRGIDIDPLARIALWQNGRDYAHGTGHGVGSYLNVHEGPQSISRRGMAELKPGMIISNEPGFYREGQYGIRIENLVLVTDLNEYDGGNTPVMGLRTLSLAPIDLSLVDPRLMNEKELHWLNAYHGWIKRTLSPHLSEEEATWLVKATRPLSNELPAASA